MITASNNCKVRNCSKCRENAEFYCKLCRCDFCLQCKEKHVQDFVTIDHNVVVYRDKFKRTSEQELQNVYKQGRQHREKFCNIRSHALFYIPVLLTETKSDIEKCHLYFSRVQAEMLTKAQFLMDHTDKVRSGFNYKHRCTFQRERQYRNIVNIQNFEKKLENSTTTPVQFLVFIRKHYICQTRASQLTQHIDIGIKERIEKRKIRNLLSEIRIKQREKRKRKKLEVMPVPTMYQSFRANELHSCHHISCVTSDRIWVNDGNGKIILINTERNILHLRKDLCKESFTGLQTVNTEGELIYIDEKFNINKLSKRFYKTDTIIEKPCLEWRPHSIYYSKLTKDLLVTMIKLDPKTGFEIERNKVAENKNVPQDHNGIQLYRRTSRIGRVARYNRSGKQKQPIIYDSSGFYMYRNPSRITENINGDIVVSDSDWPGAVFVTDSRGKHRFTYTGHPLGPSLEPWGICTDVLSHILVCDGSTRTIQMIDVNGQFKEYLLIRPLGILSPCGLAYDVKTHSLWVGSTDMNKICVYRYITRQQDSEIGEFNYIHYF